MFLHRVEVGRNTHDSVHAGIMNLLDPPRSRLKLIQLLIKRRFSGWDLYTTFLFTNLKSVKLQVKFQPRKIKRAERIFPPKQVSSLT
jgi:phospholipid N-methyltransferase